MRAQHLAPTSAMMIMLLGLISAMTPLAVDMYLPSLPAIAADLDTNISLVQHSLAAFMLGFAGSQLIYGPLSDRYGRKPVMLGGLLLFLIASLACTQAQNVEQLIWLRVLQALGGGATSVVVMAIVRDLYKGEEAARLMSLVILSMTLAPLIAPLLGAQLLLLFGWRAIFLALALIASLLLLMIWLRLPETHDAEQRTSLRPGAIARNYWAVLCHREAMGNLLAAAFSFAGMFAFITGSPYVYIQYFGVAPEHYGLLFGSNILLMILFNWTNSRVILRIGLVSMIRTATFLLLVAGILVLLGAWSGWGGLWGVFLPIVGYVGLLGLVGANTSAGTVTPFGKQAGTASALLGAVRFLFGAMAGALVSVLHNESPVPMAAIICLCGLASFGSYRLLVTKPTPLGATAPHSEPTV